MRHLSIAGSAFLLLLFVIGCQPEVEPNAVFPTPTLAIELNSGSIEEIEIVTYDNIIAETAVPFDYSKIEEEEEKQRQAAIEAIQRVEITIDLETKLSNISPYIYGVALSDPKAMRRLSPSVYSWTGDPTVRYNILDGYGWNEGREASYTNVNAFPESENHALDFIDFAESIDAATSFTLPTIGWVAKDASSCSFPDAELGNCSTGLESTCLSRSVSANPAQTSIRIDPEDMVNFLQSIKDSGNSLNFISVLYLSLIHI